MTRRLTALAAALTIALAVPATSALAYYDNGASASRAAPASSYDEYGYGPVWGSHGWCAPSSAAEGNANQQTRPVQQYGQTSGGSRC